MEVWTQLPWWLRFAVSAALVVIGVCIFCFADRIPLGLVGTLCGLGLALMFIGPSDSDKNGYRF